MSKKAELLARCASCIRHAYCGCYDVANDNFERTVTVIPDLARYHDRDFLAAILRAYSLLGRSRRGITGVYADVLKNFEGILLREDGTFLDVVNLPDDDLFGTDTSYKCINDIANYVRLAPANDPSLIMQKRSEVLAIGLRIRCPDLLPLPCDEQSIIQKMTLKEARKRA